MSTVADKLAKKSSHKTSAKQVRLRLVYIDFWSAVKLSFLAAIAIAVVTVVAFVMVFLVVQTTGLIAKVNETLSWFAQYGGPPVPDPNTGTPKSGDTAPVTAAR